MKTGDEQLDPKKGDELAKKVTNGDELKSLRHPRKCLNACFISLKGDEVTNIYRLPRTRVNVNSQLLYKKTCITPAFTELKSGSIRHFVTHA